MNQDHIVGNKQPDEESNTKWGNDEVFESDDESCNSLELLSDEFSESEDDIPIAASELEELYEQYVEPFLWNSLDTILEEKSREFGPGSSENFVCDESTGKISGSMGAGEDEEDEFSSSKTTSLAVVVPGEKKELSSSVVRLPVPRASKRTAARTTSTIKTTARGVNESFKSTSSSSSTTPRGKNNAGASAVVSSTATSSKSVVLATKKTSELKPPPKQADPQRCGGGGSSSLATPRATKTQDHHRTPRSRPVSSSRRAGVGAPTTTSNNKRSAATAAVNTLSNTSSSTATPRRGKNEGGGGVNSNHCSRSNSNKWRSNINSGGENDVLLLEKTSNVEPSSKTGNVDVEPSSRCSTDHGGPVPRRAEDNINIGSISSNPPLVNINSPMREDDGSGGREHLLHSASSDATIPPASPIVN